VAQHDYVIANGTGAAVRSDLNNGLAAIVSQNSGTTEPTTTYAYMRWADTTAGVMKMRNGANNAWITLYQLDGEWSTIAFENGSASAPSIYFKDSGTDTGIYSPGTDQVAISTAGTGRLFVNASGNVGLGTSSPQAILEMRTAVPGLRDINNALRISTEASGTDAAGAIGTGITFAQRWQNAVNNVRVGGVFGIKTASTSNYGGGVSLYYQAASDVDLAPGLTLNHQGNVGIGTTSPTALLSLSESTAPNIDFYTAGSVKRAIIKSTAAVLDINALTSNDITFTCDATERMRLTTAGRLLVGTSSSVAVGSSVGSLFQMSASTVAASLVSVEAGNNGARLFLGKSRSGTYGSYSIVSNNDEVGIIAFAADDGTDLQTQAASIKCEVDGTPGANDMPGRLVFSTTADSASSPTERMRITNDGKFGFNKTNISYTVAGFQVNSDGEAGATRDGGSPFFINRLTNDGVLVEFFQASSLEGTISVSGTTVSYNGAHLSRWSQLPGGAERTEILRGTVLSNIDEMCGWGEEDNEQLNRMKVSDVEGDPNVSGVFQAWDDDDDTYTDDFYCAMTGDFIIRIAEGVTVQRGDLLMSAGDGTAKPQDDDIIRSKTIAKVTSTHVTCTYDDGSYCVPCVLMAC